MKRFETKSALALASVLALGLATACGDSEGPEDTGIHPDATTADSGPRDTGTPDAGPTDTGNPDTGPVPDAGFIRLNFSIDDSANGTYTSTDGLAWKGSFAYDSATNIVTHAGWTGPFPLLYDDGPWDQGGHEPAGSEGNDGVWGCSIEFAVPSAAVMFEYGAIRGSIDGSDGQWIWPGPGNGMFTVNAGQTTDVTAAGLTIPAFGDINLRLEIDTSTLAEEFAEFMPANGITVKGSTWGWEEIGCVDDGTGGDVTASDGIYTFVLGENVGPGTSRPHSGLLNSGDEPQFIFVLGGVEYKVGGAGATTGVTASTQAPGGDWTEQTVEVLSSNNNTYITVP